MTETFSTASSEKPLFKYTDLQGALGILENGTLLFSSPLYFNDPFDISIQSLFGYNPLDFESFLDEFVELATSKQLPPSNESEMADKFTVINSFASEEKDEDRARLRESLSVKDIWDEVGMKTLVAETHHKIKTTFDTCGIFCASKRYDNYLLWAHYAEKHHGAVFEFFPNGKNNSILTLAEDVTYSDSRPHLYKSHKDFLFKAMFQKTENFMAEYTNKITKTKGLEWAYEEEIRIYIPLLVNIFAGKRNQSQRYDDDQLRSVYLGCKMDAATRTQIASLALRRNPKVQIFEMTPDPHYYKLHPRKYE